MLEIQTHYETGYQSAPYRRSFVPEKKTYAESHYTREEQEAIPTGLSKSRLTTDLPTARRNPSSASGRA